MTKYYFILLIFFVILCNAVFIFSNCGNNSEQSKSTTSKIVELEEENQTTKEDLSKFPDLVVNEKELDDDDLIDEKESSDFLDFFGSDDEMSLENEDSPTDKKKKAESGDKKSDIDDYDISDEQELSIKVTSTEKLKDENQPSIKVSLVEGKDKYKVILCSYSYVSKQKLKITKGDKLTIKGIVKNVNDEKVIIPRTISNEKKTLTIRDKKGKPVCD